MNKSCMRSISKCLIAVIIFVNIITGGIFNNNINVYASDNMPSTITNPGFETGDLTGWTVIEGEALTGSSISLDTTWWAENIPYNQEGTYHLNGWNNNESGAEAKTGKLRSSTFKLGGSGWITFKLGGGKDTDKCNIQVFDADTGELLSKYGNTEFANKNFPNVDQGMCLANMVQYRADLSGYIGKNLYIEIMDGATEDWGLVFADAFFTYYETAPAQGTIATNLIADNSKYELINPGFETGDITGWTVVTGAAFSTNSISNETTWWAEKIPYNQEGIYHLNGWKDGEGEEGTLRSSTFELGGSGWITFKLGGGKNTDLCNIQVFDADTDTLIAKYGNTEFADKNFPNPDQGMCLANMVQYRANLNEYIEKNLYIEIVDNAKSDWGLLFADAFFTYNQKTPLQGVIASNMIESITNEIKNPSFETGTLEGWTVVEGDAFDPNSVSNETTWWAEAIPYNQEGTYHLNGWRNGETKTGRLRSSTFILGGSGWITFRLGGGKNVGLNNIQIYNADTDELIAKYGNSEFADVNFPNVDQGMCLANMVQYRADLSDYLGQKMYIEIVDEATSDWGVMFADAFDTFNQTAPTQGVQAKNASTSVSVKTQIKNPDFEAGSLTEWTNEGDAFSVSNAAIEGKQGQYLAISDINKKGSVKSASFTLDGTGEVSFLASIEGTYNPDELYVAIVRAADDTVLEKTNELSSGALTSVSMNLGGYLGENVYIKVVDDSENGSIKVDDFNVCGKGLIAHWSFDENSGTTAKDDVRQKNDYVNYVFNNAVYKSSSDPLWKSKGIMGGALLFDGFSTYIERDSTQVSQVSDQLTIEAWVAPRAFEEGQTNKFSAIVSQHDKILTKGFCFGIDKHGAWGLRIAVGGKWQEVLASGSNALKAHEWAHVAAIFDKKESMIRLYLNGIEVASGSISKDVPITPSNDNLKIGRENYASVIAGVFYQNMFNGMMDDVKMYNEALTPEQVKQSYDSYLTQYSGSIPKIEWSELAHNPDILKDDMYRPAYHAVAPSAWMNECHAPVYFNGKYHLFYQFNQNGPYFGYLNWGHWVSDDMVHWEYEPVALTPEAGNLDPNGCWSGSALVDKNGIPTIFYTAGNANKSPNQSVALATPVDLSDPYLKEWTKNPTPVAEKPNGIGNSGQFRDPFTWYDAETEKYYMLVTSGIPGGGGSAMTFVSSDKINWEYKGFFYQSDFAKYPYLGENWELTGMLPVEGPNGMKKYIFWVLPQSGQADVEIYYWLGDFDKENVRFIPEQEEPQKFDVGKNLLKGPSGFVAPDGRSIMITMIEGNRTPQIDVESGYSAHHVGLPLNLSLGADGKLRVDPIVELESLRGAKLASFQNKSLESANDLLKNVKGDMLEINLEIKPEDAKKFGIKVRCSPNGEEETLVYYDVNGQTFNVDRSKTSINPDMKSYGVDGGSLQLDGENLKLHIYIDRSTLEAFANSKKKITTHVYNGRYDSLGLKMWADGKINVVSMDVWEMKSSDGETVPVYKPAGADAVYNDVTNIPNHDFATGNLTGWIAEGFDDSIVSNLKTFGNVLFNPSGRMPGVYHFMGFGKNALTGTLKSQDFVLGGNGKIDFLLSGGNDIDNLYVALVRATDGKELIKATSIDYDEYQRVRWDASQYIGEKLYFKLVDNSTQNPFGHLNLDDVHVPVKIEKADDVKQPEGSTGSNTVPISSNSVVNDNKITITPKFDVDTGIASSMLEDTDLIKAMEKATVNKDGVKSIVVDVQEIKGAKEYLQEISASKISTLAENMRIEINTSLGSIVLPNNLLKPEDVQGVKKIGISIANADLSKEDNLLRQKIGDRPVVELQMLKDGKAYAWSNADTPMTIILNYKPTSDELKDPEHIVVWYIDGEGNTQAVPNAKYDVKTGEVVFTVTHFSKYAICFNEVKFSDLSRFKWAENQIEVMASKGVITDLPGGKFNPEQNITRGMLIDYIIKSLGLTASIDSNFIDVKTSDNCYESIGIAKKLGIVAGIGQNKFNPNAEITRQDMMIIVDKALRIAKKISSKGDAQDIAKFADTSKIAGYAFESVATLVKEEVISGNGKMIDPTGKVTKAQAAVIAYKIYNK